MSRILSKLKIALTNTSNKISDGIENIFFKKRLDKASLEDFEELLISSDISVSVTKMIIDLLYKQKFNKEVTSDAIKFTVSSIINDIIQKQNHEFVINKNGLNVIILSGVNGNGKTTTIGKMAHKYVKSGKKVGVVACDTFRAAASHQLKKWADAAGAIFYSGDYKADPASVVYKAISNALIDHVDILLIDTAGRLHNQSNLMDELSKIIRVVKKLIPEAPHHSLLVLDGTIGQNAILQAKEFKEKANISGLIVTKLDGTSKGGFVISIIDQFSLPVHFIAVGESAEDLKIFNTQEFSDAIVGL